MGPLFYFAYGSNLHPGRLRGRAKSARVLGPAFLRGYRSGFRKRGRDGSAKCDIWPTGRRRDLVQGVVYRIARGERRLIDRAEDLGRGYEMVRLRVSMDGRPRQVFAYLALPDAVVEGLLPFDWYLDYMVRGGRYHRLPGRYLAALTRIGGLRDPNAARRRLNLRVSRRTGAARSTARPLPRLRREDGSPHRPRPEAGAATGRRPRRPCVRGLPRGPSRA